MPICESQEAPFSRLLDTKTWAPQKGCDGDEDAGGVYVKVLKSSRWSAPTRGSQGKNPGDVPLKMSGEEKRQQVEKSKKKTVRQEGGKSKKEGSRGGHGQRYPMLHKRYGWRKPRRCGNVEVTADLWQRGLPEEAGEKLKSRCILINTNDFNPIANHLGLFALFSKQH